MKALPIAHIGILVGDLETARERWSTVLDTPFSPISRYQPQNWSDLGNPEPHLHDARLTFCLGDNPSIEILEFVGNGTHSPEKGEGGPHLSFPPIEDNHARRAELAELGIGTDGEIHHQGRWIFTFSDARALNNVYTEWVEEHPDHPDVKDDGSPVDRLPDGNKTLFDVDTILSLEGHRPPSGITEFGVVVRSLDQAAEIWSKVTGYTFDSSGTGSLDEVPGATGRTAVSPGEGTSIRLVEAKGEKEGLFYAAVSVEDLNRTLSRLENSGAPVLDSRRDADGNVVRIDIDPSFLNNFSIRFQ